MSKKFKKFGRSLLGLDTDPVYERKDGSVVYRPIGGDLHIVKMTIRDHIQNKISNIVLKDELSHYITEDEANDLDNWFPDEVDKVTAEDNAEFICDDLITAMSDGLNLCRVMGCTNIRQKGEVCVKHGAKTECNYGNCTNHAQKGGLCVKHGAVVKQCSYGNCKNNVVKGGVCRRHGAKTECNYEGCTNNAQKGGVCIKHGANKGKDKAAKRKRAREESDDEDGDEHIVRVVAEAQKITRNERATRRRK